MKKSFFGLFLAVMAVCSLALTSCHEKDPKVETPSEYYVVGSVYDAETGSVISNATVTLDGVAVSSTFKVKLNSYVPSVTVAASAEGYVAASRTVSIDKLAEFQTIQTIQISQLSLYWYSGHLLRVQSWMLRLLRLCSTSV